MELQELDPNVFKIITCLFILMLGLIGGFMPKFVYKKQKNEDDNNNDNDNGDDELLAQSQSQPQPQQKSLQASLLNMFTGGIFFSSALLHFLPDATDNEEMKVYLARLTGLPEDYPFAMLLTAIGFFLLLTVEAMVHEWNVSGTCAGAKLDKCCCCCCGFGFFNVRVLGRGRNHGNLQDDLLSSEHPPQNHGNNSTLHASSSSDHEANNLFNDNNTMNDNACPENNHVNGGNNNHNHDNDDDISYESQEDEGLNLLHDNIHHQQDANNNSFDNQEEDINSSTIVSLVVFLSLSIHSFMAGLGKILQNEKDLRYISHYDRN